MKLVFDLSFFVKLKSWLQSSQHYYFYTWLNVPFCDKKTLDYMYVQIRNMPIMRRFNHLHRCWIEFFSIVHITDVMDLSWKCRKQGNKSGHKRGTKQRSILLISLRTRNGQVSVTTVTSWGTSALMQLRLKRCRHFNFQKQNFICNYADRICNNIVDNNFPTNNLIGFNK